MKNTTKLILIGITDCIIVASGCSLWWLTKSADNFLWVKEKIPNEGTILSITTMVLSLVTFFGILTASESSGRGWGLNKGGMRGAIAATILVIYFFVLSINLFILNSGFFNNQASLDRNFNLHLLKNRSLFF
jgi:hypothetical protein